MKIFLKKIIIKYKYISKNSKGLTGFLGNTFFNSTLQCFIAKLNDF